MSKKSKLTLIVDGNWLLMSRLSVLNHKYVDDYDLCQNLKLMMIRSMNIVLKQFQDIDNIIFVTDGGSWRNKLEVPEFLKKDGIEYKGTRVKSDDINWEVIFSSYEEFITILNSTGITACKETGIEGDDWCYHWSKLLNEQGTNCIIWTKDRDLTQLVKMDKNNCFTIWWNKDTGVITENFEEEEMDFLFNNKFSENETIYNNIIKNVKNVTKINPNDVVIEKIIKGDTSDNILPIILRCSKNGTSDKKYKVSQKDIDYTLDINNIDNVKLYINNIINSKAYVGRVNKSFDDIIEHFEYNKKLVWLNERVYPEEIVNKLNKYTEYSVSKNTTIAESQINAAANKLNGILDLI